MIPHDSALIQGSQELIRFVDGKVFRNELPMETKSSGFSEIHHGFHSVHRRSLSPVPEKDLIAGSSET